MAGLAGKNMRLDFGTSPTHMRVTRGTLTSRTQLVETTNSESLGHEEYVFGVDGCDLEAEVIYTYSSPAVFAIMGNNPSGGGNSGVCTFYPDKGVVGSTFSGTLMIESFQITSEEKGAITARITGKFTAHTTAGVVDGAGITATSV